jgi:hypothetical protein
VLLHRMGWKNVVAAFWATRFCFLWVLFISGIRYMLRTSAWRLTFLAAEQIPFWRLFQGMIAGEALAYLTFTGPFLGEPLKAAMVKNVSFGKSLTSTVVEAFLNTVSATLLTFAGLLLLAALPWRSAHPFAYQGFGISICGLLLIGGFLGLKFISSIFTFVIRRLHSSGRSKQHRWEDYCSLVEERLEHVRRDRPGSIEKILAITIICQLLLILEIVLALWPLGYRLDWTTLLVIEAGTKLAKAIFFFIPARVGADEGSSAGIFKLLGMSSYPGITLVLVRRMRALTWSFLGLAFLALENRRAAAPLTGPSSTPHRPPEQKPEGRALTSYDEQR